LTASIRNGAETTMTATHSTRADDHLLAMLASEAFIRDPGPAYRVFLDRPGWRTPTGYHVFARYDDVLTILRDPRTFGQETRAQPSFHQMDPPEHTRLRRLVSRAFTPRAIDRQRQHITELVDSLLDEVVEDGEMDVAEAFASRLPAMVMSVLLGIPVADGRRWRTYIQVMAAQRGLAHYLDREPGDRELRDKRRQVVSREQADFLLTLVQQRKERKGDDVVSALLDARDEDESLTDDEVLFSLLLLIGAGMHTTAGQIGNLLEALLTHPDQLDLLRDCPNLIENTVDEGFRFVGALQAEHRVVRVDGEVAGVQLSAGERVLIVNGAANRDPRVFTDPDAFDVRRANAGDHLTFGWGVHRCLGAPLARMEVEISLQRLVDRLPDLALSGPARMQPYDRLRGLEHLPVRWRVGQAATAGGR
jgi:cytochrome P450